jgi:RNA-binding protein PNO1
MEKDIEITDTIETGNIDNNIEELMTVDVNQIQQSETKTVKQEYRRVLVPANRMKPLKENWSNIVKALVEHMKIQVKMNTKTKCVEMRSYEKTEESSALQKSEEFLKAFMCGFEVQDAIAMLRLEDLYLETFEVKDVKNLQGDHLSRCIGRICGEKGKTKNSIENATRTRIILQGSKISLLGSSSNIILARNAICSLILGAPPGKVYSSLRIIGKRINEKI